MLISSVPHMHFFHFSDTCYLGSNDSTKFLESIVVFIFFWRAALALVLECYTSIIQPIHCFEFHGHGIMTTSIAHHIDLYQLTFI
jgi:hypothetical protein